MFVATDAPSHARRCCKALNHGKHIMTAVPAVWGSLPDAEQPVQMVRRTGLTHMMAETSCYHAACHAMRKVHCAGGLGRVVYGGGGFMVGLHYHGALQELPDTSRPALPPGVPAGGHGG